MAREKKPDDGRRKKSENNIYGFKQKAYKKD